MSARFPPLKAPASPAAPAATAATAAGASTQPLRPLPAHGHKKSMEGRQADYTQSGLNSPYPLPTAEPQSEGSPADQASAAQYSTTPDHRSNTFSSSATPTSSEYSINPPSARSASSYPEYIQRPQQHYPHTAQPPQPGNMAQATNPSIAAGASSSYPPHGQYQTYPPQQHDMPSHYHPYGRPEPWGPNYQNFYGAPPVNPNQQPPPMVSPVPRPPAGGHPLSTVYSFVPIPGATQNKRPRRRYEEIERMYKCGWNGCEKAYGTLNHLNAHVTMQSHGQKRTPEEFKEIRREWKAKKKEEEAQRKADEERHRQAEQQRQAQRSDASNSNPETPIYGQARMPQPGGPQLPPIGYAPAASGQASSYGTQSPTAMAAEMGQYAAASPHVYSSSTSNATRSYPPSPYQPQGLYPQSADAGSNFQ